MNVKSQYSILYLRLGIFFVFLSTYLSRTKEKWNWNLQKRERKFLLLIIWPFSKLRRSNCLIDRTHLLHEIVQFINNWSDQFNRQVYHERLHETQSSKGINQTTSDTFLDDFPKRKAVAKSISSGPFTSSKFNLEPAVKWFCFVWNIVGHHTR